MSTEFQVGKLSAQRRYDHGKGAARKIRAKGFIPGTCYGRGEPPISLVFDPLELKGSLDPVKRKNTLIELTIQDGSKTECFHVMLKDHQLNLLKQSLTHADFIKIHEQDIVEANVPLVLEGKAEGLKIGGVLHQVFRTLPVKCPAKSIPEAIKVDITSLNIGDSIRVQDIPMLDQAVHINLHPTKTVALVMLPKKVKEGGAGEGEAAATAADAKPDAAAAPAAGEKKAAEKK